MKPYKFEPYLKTTLWGGYQIAPFKGIFTAQPNIGETILVPASENVLYIFGNASFLTATIS